MSLTKEQLKLRSKYITGTRISALLGVNKYSSPLDVYNDMMGISPAFEGNAATKRGEILEPYILKAFQAKTGIPTVQPKGKWDLWIKSKTNDLHGGFVDGYAGQGIIEGKSTRMRIKSHTDRLDWYSQLEWYLYTSDKDVGYLAWLTLPEESSDENLVQMLQGKKYSKEALDMLLAICDFDYIEVKKDKDLVELMIETADKFYTDHILTKTPPKPTNYSEAYGSFPSAKPNSLIQGTREHLEMHDRYKILTKQIAELTKEKDGIKNEISVYMGDNELLYFEDRKLFSWKNNKDSENFSANKFKEDNPDLYAQYVVKSPGARVLRA